MENQDKHHIAEIKKLRAQLKKISVKHYGGKLHQAVDDWRVRSSRISHVVTNRPELTKNQLDLIDSLSFRKHQSEMPNSGVKPLTQNMEDDLAKLIAKRDAPDVLPEGAIRFVEDELDEVIYEIRSEVSSKEMEKGTISEPLVLALVAENYNRENGTNILLVPNRERRSNLWISGEIDEEFNNTVIEAKSPWSRSTWRRKEVVETEYYWQCQGYTILWKKPMALVAYGLVDAPEHLIKDQYERELWLQGVSGESEEAVEIENMVRERMTFSHKIPSMKRLKCFRFPAKKEDHKFITSRAIMCKKLMYEMAIDWLTINPDVVVVGEL